MNYLARNLSSPIPSNESGYIGIFSSSISYTAGQIVLYITTTIPTTSSQFTFWYANLNCPSSSGTPDQNSNWVRIFDTGIVPNNKVISSNSGITKLYGADPTVFLSYLPRYQLVRFITNLASISLGGVNYNNFLSYTNLYSKLRTSIAIVPTRTFPLTGGTETITSFINSLITNQTSSSFFTTYPASITLTQVGGSAYYYAYADIANTLWTLENFIATFNNDYGLGTSSNLNYNSRYFKYLDSPKPSATLYPSIGQIGTATTTPTRWYY